MKLETELIDEDEWLIRLVWGDRVTPRVPTISPSSFEPRTSEADGIRLFRRSCLDDPVDALAAISDKTKRPRYAIVQLLIRLLTTLGLSVRESPIPAVPGHVVIPELNHDEHNAD